jgi:putative transcriptional regulator
LNNLPKQTQPTLLRDKGEFTKFQILLEIKRNQPHIKQKQIAEALGITIQAISKYFKKLTKEGLLESGTERADYRLTPKAIGKLHDDLRNLENYVQTVKQEMKIERALPAITTHPVKAGQEVGIIMKGGVMYTVPPENAAIQAIGTVITDADTGEDIGLRNLKGKIQLNQGKILIVKLPSIKKGGSRTTDLQKVKAFYEEFKPDRIGVMGAVGRAVLNKLGLKTDIEFGISRTAAIAASRGLNVMVLVVGRMTNRITEEIENVNMRNGTDIIYEIKDARTTTDLA